MQEKKGILLSIINSQPPTETVHTYMSIFYSFMCCPCKGDNWYPLNWLIPHFME